MRRCRGLPSHGYERLLGKEHYETKDCARNLAVIYAKYMNVG